MPDEAPQEIADLVHRCTGDAESRPEAQECAKIIGRYTLDGDASVKRRSTGSGRLRPAAAAAAVQAEQQRGDSGPPVGGLPQPMGDPAQPLGIAPQPVGDSGLPLMDPGELLGDPEQEKGDPTQPSGGPMQQRGDPGQPVGASETSGQQEGGLAQPAGNESQQGRSGARKILGSQSEGAAQPGQPAETSWQPGVVSDGGRRELRRVFPPKSPFES